MEELSSSLAILSAMLTPAVLISACGSLTISTSNRLTRAIARAHDLRQRLEASGQRGDDGAVERHGRERRMMLRLLRRVTRRARLLQRAMSFLYMAIGLFVATSVAIGVVAFIHTDQTWVPIAVGLAGVSLLFYACALLIVESRINLAGIDEEMAHLAEQREWPTP